ncbi:hypothetical protein PG990_014712 [Apiospora arundinis]|uniref:Sterigmatocystin biosynthesis P450 monooxygenase n=1 Tax=Apiospora arundinis TaxID=335852 RepID=A0ABR2HJY1_9PEZI
MAVSTPPIHVTVLPASTQSGKATIRALLNAEEKPLVRGIYRDTSKAPEEFTNNPRFDAAKGDIDLWAGLDFRGSDVVFYNPPPTFDGRDASLFATQAANNVRATLKRVPSVKRLVISSAMGSQYESGTGILRLNHVTDSILKDAVPEVIIVKPAYYYHTWISAAQIKGSGTLRIESPLEDPEYKVPMVSVEDIGRCCAGYLLNRDRSSKPGVRSVDLHGPRSYSPRDVHEAIEKVTGKDWELVNIPRAELAETFGKKVPAAYVPDFVEMITAVLPGGALAGDLEGGKDTVRGTVELEDALRKMLSE